jgi:hypothetical protein
MRKLEFTIRGKKPMFGLVDYTDYFLRMSRGIRNINRLKIDDLYGD